MEHCIIRIDDRLIHGQVIVGWVHRLNLKHIVIVNDGICKNAMRQRLMMMAVPDDIEIDFMDLKQFVAAMKKATDNKKKGCIILFESAQDVVRSVKSGAPIKRVNVGGLHYQEGKTQLAPFLSVDDEDVKALKFLMKKDIELEGRALPLDEKVDVGNLLEGK